MENEMNTPDIHQVAILVAQYLTTRHESKKHGGYQIFEDDRLRISYGTYYPNLNIVVKDGDKTVTVLSRGGSGTVSEYHPGRWEDYVRSLYPKAKAAQETKEREWREKCEAEKRRKFEPIDDSHIFA
jgi:hypothetical protein